jgi:hypothetical protein
VTGLPGGNEVGGENGRLTVITEQTATDVKERFHIGY